MNVRMLLARIRRFQRAATMMRTAARLVEVMHSPIVESGKRVLEVRAWIPGG
jgi:hypothetical protein